MSNYLCQTWRQGRQGEVFTIGLTPLDLENIEFGRGFRGYRAEEVDSFLQKILREYEKVFKENQELKLELERSADSLQHYRELEGTLRNTMLVAQKTAEDLRFNAEKEAELICQEAKARAEEILAEAKRRWEAEQRKCQELEQYADTLRIKLRSFLRAQLDMLDVDHRGEQALIG